MKKLSDLLSLINHHDIALPLSILAVAAVLTPLSYSAGQWMIQDRDEKYREQVRHVQALEIRLIAVEAAAKENREHCDGRIKGIHTMIDAQDDLCKSRYDGLHSAMTNVWNAQGESSEAMLNWLQALSGKQTEPKSKQPTIPTVIYEGIKREAAKQWPKSYAMQEWEIKYQVDAYLKLHR